MNGQTVVWQLQPTQYDEISRVGSNLYIVKHNEKIGLIRSDGTIVSPVENDKIGDFYERKALVTSTDSHGECITGCMTDDGVFHAFAAKYYTLNGQKFFSDGLLSVADETGNLGYIDEYGKPVVGFEGKYTRIKPFTEGFAAVMKNKKYVLIDKDGTEVKFRYGGNGIGSAIGGCTNVFNGKAYVYDEYGGADRTYYLYDARTKSPLEKTKRVKDTATDYLYCYQSVSGRTKEVPFKKMEIKPGVPGVSPSFNGSLYGYQEGGKVILPEQLSSATPFEDGYAIVKLNGQLGILKYIEGNGFSAVNPNNQFSLYDDELKVLTCTFTLLSPGVWRNKDIDVKVRDASGNLVPVKKGAENSYSFGFKPSKTCEKKYEVAVFADGLKLFVAPLSYSFKVKHKEEIKEKVCPTCGKPISTCPYQGVH